MSGPNIIIKRSSESESRTVASAEVMQSMKNQKEEIDRIIQSGKSAGEYAPKIDLSGKIKEANMLQDAIDRTGPINYRGADKDKAYRFMKSVQEQFSQNAPTEAQMRDPSAFNIDHNKAWHFKEYNFDGVKMTGKQAEREYQIRARSLGEDSLKTRLENFRRKQ